MPGLVCEEDQARNSAIAAYRGDRKRRTIFISNQHEQLASVDLQLDWNIQTRFAFAVYVHPIDDGVGDRTLVDAIVSDLRRSESDRAREQRLARLDAERRQSEIRRAKIDIGPRDAETFVARFDRDRHRLHGRGCARLMQLGASERHRFRLPIVNRESQEFPRAFGEWHARFRCAIGKLKDRRARGESLPIRAIV